MSSKKSLLKSKKIVLGIAVALGCSLVSVVSAENMDTWHNRTFGYSIEKAIGTSYNQPMVFEYGYDKSSNKVKGGKIIVKNGAKGKYIYAVMQVKEKD